MFGEEPLDDESVLVKAGVDDCLKGVDTDHVNPGLHIILRTRELKRDVFDLAKEGFLVNIARDIGEDLLVLLSTHFVEVADEELLVALENVVHLIAHLRIKRDLKSRHRIDPLPVDFEQFGIAPGFREARVVPKVDQIALKAHEESLVFLQVEASELGALFVVALTAL